jgi:nucleoside-diphosphate-sugar epimerase
MKRILVTGACGQVGSELVPALRDRYGSEEVIAIGHKTSPGEKFLNSGPFHFADCTNFNSIKEMVKQYNVGTIYHLAAILSAVGERNPQIAWNTNINGLYNILEIAREYSCAVFTPSSFGVFGPNAPLDNTPQNTIQRPNTIYGVTKVSGELLCDYYHKRFEVDTRGVRWPGLISSITLPGGGTTDYAVEIFYAAIKHKKYTSCFIKEDTYMDMMYMPDAIKSAICIMESDPRDLKHRNAYNITAISCAPKDIAKEIQKYIPDFIIEYDIDPVRQAIAESWPNCMDDSAARTEWGWNPEYDLASITKDMLEKLSEKLR